MVGETYILYHQLYGVAFTSIVGLLDSVADVNGLMSVYVFEIWCHIEGYGIYDMAGAIVFKF